MLSRNPVPVNKVCLNLHLSIIFNQHRLTSTLMILLLHIRLLLVNVVYTRIHELTANIRQVDRGGRVGGFIVHVKVFRVLEKLD